MLDCRFRNAVAEGLGLAQWERVAVVGETLRPQVTGRHTAAGMQLTAYSRRHTAAGIQPRAYSSNSAPRVSVPWQTPSPTDLQLHPSQRAHRVFLDTLNTVASSFNAAREAALKR